MKTIVESEIIDIVNEIVKAIIDINTIGEVNPTTLDRLTLFINQRRSRGEK